MKLVLLLVLALTIPSGESYFNCQKPSMECQNGGVCPDGFTTCTCAPEYEGDDCAVEKASINGQGCLDTTCTNGYCMAGGTCKCPPQYYGTRCHLKRFQAVCTENSMLILINPYPTYNGLMYIEGKPSDPCVLLEIPSNPTDALIPTGSQGRYLKLAHTDQRCGETISGTREGLAGVSVTRKVSASYRVGDVTIAMDHFEFSCRYLPITQVVESSFINVNDVIPSTLATGGGTTENPNSAPSHTTIGFASILICQLVVLLLR